MRNLISIGAVGILVVIGILVSLPPAVVQSAPLPTGTVPASDLNPYQETKTFNWANCGFAGNQACAITFSAVPAGKRLIVENISGELVLSFGPPEDLGTVRTVKLSPSNAESPSWHVPTVLQSTFIDATTHAINSQVLAHFEAGQIPKVFINTDSINAGFNNELTLSGHFVQVQ